MRIGAIQAGPGGYLILYAWVFAEQIGLPLPATPALLAAGGFAAAGRLNLALTLATAVNASMLADYLWYRAGALGTDVVDRLVRRHPDSKILRFAEQLAARHGSRTLVFAKFVPGLSLAAPPLSGVSGAGATEFLMFDGLGSLIWAGWWIGIGYFLGCGHIAAPLSFSPGSCALLCAAFALGAAAFHFAPEWWSKVRGRSLDREVSARLTRIYSAIPDQLTWLSNLITDEVRFGPDPALEPLKPREAAYPVFERWMTVWFRKIVIAKALGRVAAELRDSARRTESLDPSQCLERPAPLESSRGRIIHQARLERALLAIDLFPRCVVLLTLFERLSLDDTLVLLDANRKQVVKAQAIGLAALLESLPRERDRAAGPLAVARPALVELQPTT